MESCRPRLVLLLVCVFLLGVTSGRTNSSGQARDYSGGYTGSGGYDNYYDSYSHDKWPHFSTTSITEGGNQGCGMWLKAGLIAIVGVALLKLPVLLALKFVLLKLALPLGFLLAVAPVLLPFVYMFYKMGEGAGMSMTTPAPMMMMVGNSTKRSSRSLESQDPLLLFLNSPSCLETIACRLGETHASTAYSKPISWILKSAQRLWKEGEGLREKLASYRAAYREGTSNLGCTKYHCEMPHLLLKQDQSTVRVL